MQYISLSIWIGGLAMIDLLNCTQEEYEDEMERLWWEMAVHLPDPKIIEACAKEV